MQTFLKVLGDARAVLHAMTGVALLMLLIGLVLVIFLRGLGVPLRVGSIGHMELAYLGGAWWLLKG